MKKVLITGASTSLGLNILNNLLVQDSYEITALDLNNKNNQKRLKKYHKQINVIYGDMNEPILIDNLIKTHDYIIYCSIINPPFCNLNRRIGEQIEYREIKHLIKNINNYNPKCLLIYPSTTNLYEKKSKEIILSSKINYSQVDYYSYIKEKCEKLIQEKLTNYYIFRFPFILEDIKQSKFIFLYNKNEEIELITNKDAARALSSSLEYQNILNRKIKIISGGINCRINSNELKLKVLTYYGYTFQMLWNKIFNTFLYHGNIFKTDKKITQLLNYQNNSIDSYFEELKENYSKNILRILISKPLKWKLERSVKK